MTSPTPHQLADRLDAALRDGSAPPEPSPAFDLAAGRAALRARRRLQVASAAACMVLATVGGVALAQWLPAPEPGTTVTVASAPEAPGEPATGLRYSSPGKPFVQPWNGRSVYYFGQDAKPAVVEPGTDRFVAAPGSRILEQRREPGVVVDQEGSVATSVVLVERDGARSYMVLVRDAEGRGETYAVPSERGGADLDAFVDLVVRSGEAYGSGPAGPGRTDR